MQLCEKNLNKLPAHVQRPTYDRGQVARAIVHLGVGAFHRAHQAMYTDAVLASGDLAWGIVGAGIVSSNMKEALQPQDGLYTLAVMGPSGNKVQIIGSILAVLGGKDDDGQLLKIMRQPSTRIVSLTVTEKGYYLDPATGQLQLEAPAIQSDLANPQGPKTVLGLIVQALAHRKAAGITPFTVLSCDNLPSNGKRAKAAVVAYAHEVDPALGRWIASEVAFPCTMVDRITPATTDADRAAIAEQIGLQDAWPVVTEDFSQWVIEDNFTMGRPDWTLGGAVFSDEIEAWENMKLRCLNGTHSTLAYLGQLTGRETVAQAMQVPLITELLDALWVEIRQVLVQPKGVDAAAYVESLKQRFCNPAIKHRTAQIAMDGSQKLPQRLLSTLRDRLAANLPSPALATAIAAWMHFAVKTAHTPDAVLNDPLSAEILAKAKISLQPKQLVHSLLSIQKIFGSDLIQHSGFVAELERAFVQLANNPDVATAEAITR